MSGSAPDCPWMKRSIDYRRGFVEGQAGERDVYVLLTGCTNVEEYERGFIDGQKTQEKECEELK